MFVKGSPEYYMQVARHEWIKKNINGLKPSCVVIKTTQDCNLRCKYCYTEGGKQKESICVKTVLTLFDQIVVNNNSDIDCVFHGGEPLLCTDLIEDIIQNIKSRYYGPRIKFKIQTNGTLINSKVIQLIKKYNIDIGISIDGYKSLNDHTRVFGDGSSSYPKVMEGMKQLFDNNILFGVLCLVTKYNVNHIVDILEWCKETGLDRIGFTTFTPLGYGKEENLAPDLDELSNNTIKEIEWLIKHNDEESKTTKKYIYEREIESLVIRILNPEKCAYMCTDIPCGAGQRHIGLDVNGDINICDCFYGMADYVLGNINTQSLDDILSNKLVKEFGERNIHKLEGCQDCDINNICHGGCPSHNIIFLGKDGLYKRSYKCQYFYTIYKYLLKRLKEDGVNPALLAEMYLEEI